MLFKRLIQNTKIIKRSFHPNFNGNNNNNNKNAISAVFITFLCIYFVIKN
jgi:hypothetical protein